MTAESIAARNDGVATELSWRENPGAVCHSCKWMRTGRTASEWLAIRAAARRHTGSTGHVTSASVRTGYTYHRVGHAPAG